MKIEGIILIFLSLAPLALAWQGNVCSRLICTSVRQRVCAYQTWRGCCYYKWVWRTVYKREYFCCAGWRDTAGNQNCNIPICNPGCQNGGTCIRPNTCSCTPGRTGPTCTGVLTCSHLKPCFPGDCTNAQCQCQDGFDDATCATRLLRNDQLTQIWLHRTTLSNVERVSNMMKYSYVTDSSNPSDPAADILWSNQLDYNYLMVQATGQFEPSFIPPNPSYVMDSGFGVRETTLSVKHTKIPRPGTVLDPTIKNYTCDTDNGTNSRVYGIWNCTFREPNFVQKLESGDELSITVTFMSGGFRDLSVSGTNTLYKSENFNLLPSDKTVIFKFDKIPPTHCLTTKNCANQGFPLIVSPDITKTGVNIVFSGWQDSLSGMYRYAWEVFKLEKVDINERLGEKEPLNPLRITEVFEGNLSLPIRYQPPEPGVYSVILEASDRANNSRYSRQIFLFDNQSSVELKSQIRIPTAANLTNLINIWQSDLTGDVVLDWSGHFVNTMHRDNGFLNEVLKYPEQFAGVDPQVGSLANFKIKSILFDDDDDEVGAGGRTLSRINNIDGIVQFTLGVNRNGRNLISKTLLNDSYRLQQSDLGGPIQDGDSVDINIQGQDIMGNRRDDSTRLFFDSSPPVMSDLALDSTAQGQYEFGQRLQFTSTDNHSGIHEIRFQVEKVNKPGDSPVQVHQAVIKGPRIQSCTPGDECYCVKMGDCFNRQYKIDVNFCWFKIERNFLTSASANLHVSVVNPAGLMDSRSYQFLNMGDSLQKNYYLPPSKVWVKSVGPNSATIGWNISTSCFPISEFWLVRSDAEGKQKVHRLRREIDLTSFQPNSNNSVQIIAGYDGQMSDAISVIFFTPEPQGLTAGESAGIGIGVILIIILIIIGAYVLYSLGYLTGAAGKRKKDYSTGTESAPQRSRFDGNEDIYIYGFGGSDGLNLPTCHIIDRDNLILEDFLEQGKFAKIYRASLVDKAGDKTTVVAKMLLDNFTEEEKHLMCGKITFMSDVITGHENVLKFVGAVLDNEGWGPTMVLEYCEEGTLISWLHKHKQSVNDDILEKLFQFAFGILKGMAYLSSINVIHRRLAARNILMTFVLEPKITGFGPSVVDTTEDQQKERVPIRWVAPECFASTKGATEKSDVWSYGIVLYELFSMGDQPYPLLSTQEVIPKVKGGHRMNRPELSDEFNYGIMTKSWRIEQNDRPSFQELYGLYNNFMNGEPQSGDYSNYSSKY